MCYLCTQQSLLVVTDSKWLEPTLSDFYGIKRNMSNTYCQCTESFYLKKILRYKAILLTMQMSKDLLKIMQLNPSTKKYLSCCDKDYQKIFHPFQAVFISKAACIDIRMNLATIILTRGQTEEASLFVLPFKEISTPYAY